jgi:hypothetical protein
LPDDEGYSLFTVDSGKAAEHKVTIGMKNDESILVTGEGLSAGQSVVIVGNMELEDGMAVKTSSGDEPTTSPVTTKESVGQEAAQ